MEKINSKETLIRLIDQYQNLIFSVCLKMTGDYFTAEDLTQEILTEVLPYLNIFMTEELSEEEIADLEARGLYNANLVKPSEEESEEGTSEESSEGENSESPSEEPMKPEVQIDPETGYAIDPYTGELLDPETGRPINPGSGLIQGGPQTSEE